MRVFLEMLPIAAAVPIAVLVSLQALEAKWLFVALAAVTFLIVIFAVGIAKRGFEALLLFSLFARVDVSPGWSSTQPVVHPGIPLTLSLIALIPLYVMRAFATVRGPRGRNPRIPLAMLAPVSLLVVLAVMSVFWAPSAERVLRGLVYLLQGVLAFLYFARETENKEDVLFITGTICWWMAVSSGIGVLQHFVPSSFGLGFVKAGEPSQDFVGSFEIRRVTGLEQTPNECARGLAIWLPLAMLFAVAPGYGWRHRAAPLVACALGGVALVMTYSRGGLLTFICAAFLGILAYRSRKQVRHALGSGARRILALAVLGTLLTVPVLPTLYQRLVRPDEGQAASRLVMASVALDLVSENYAKGVGLNNYILEMGKYDSTPERITEAFPYAVHNFYLLLTGELGVLALLSFAVMTIAVLRIALQETGASRALVTLFRLGLGLAVSSFLLNGFIEGSSLGSHMMMHYWIAAGCIVGASSVAQVSVEDSHMRGRSGSTP